MIGSSGVAVVAVVLAMFAAIGVGLEGILAKRGIAAGGNAVLASFTTATVALVLYWIVVLALGGGTAILESDPEAIGIFLVAGVIGSGLGVLAVYQGVDRVGASINTAIHNSRPLFVAVVGFLFLGEGLAPSTSIGIVVIVGGVVLIALSRGGDIRGWGPIDLVFPLGAAVLFGTGNVIRRYGLTTTDLTVFEGIAINAAGGFAVLACYVFLVQGPDVLRAPKRAYGWFLGMGGVMGVALLALFGALQRERVAIVDSIAAASPLFALLFTAIFLRELEVVTRRVLLGAALVMVGGILIVGL